MKPEVKELLEKQQYRFTGRHSAVKICTWTKNSIRGGGVCYKQKFYGINSHQCVQMSPAIGFCHNRCIFCWRPTKYTEGIVMKDPDQSRDLINKCVEQQKSLLTGFFGNENADKKKLTEAMKPKHFAISLSGEPTLYPKLNELVEELHKEGYSTFIVTNGMEPKRLEKIRLPTQLYLSVDAPNEALFNRIDRSILKDGWKRLNKSLTIMKDLGKKTRTCLRFTMLKGINMVYPEKWAAIIDQAQPWFVEVKGYMYVGCSKARMKKENMPRHSDIRAFSEQIVKHSDYIIADEQERSRVVLLTRPNINEIRIGFRT